jgi:putative transposase
VLLGLPRSTLYYRPIPVRESTLRIMARIDVLYLEDPCSGSRRMVGYLARDGIPIRIAFRPVNDRMARLGEGERHRWPDGRMAGRRLDCFIPNEIWAHDCMQFRVS